MSKEILKLLQNAEEGMPVGHKRHKDYNTRGAIDYGKWAEERTRHKRNGISTYGYHL